MLSIMRSRCVSLYNARAILILLYKLTIWYSKNNYYNSKLWRTSTIFTSYHFTTHVIFFTRITLNHCDFKFLLSSHFRFIHIHLRILRSHVICLMPSIYSATLNWAMYALLSQKQKFSIISNEIQFQ